VVETDNRNNQVTKTGVLSEDIGHNNPNVYWAAGVKQNKTV
jgi:hypothetical protein